MTDYPEEFVGRVADILVEFAPDNPPGVQQMWSYGVAERILDALNFKRDAEYGHLIGPWLHRSTLDPGQHEYERWTAQTEWKEVG